MRPGRKPIEIRPPMGGQLMTAPSADTPGPANYKLKRDWRRVDDCEQRSEGYDFFRPNTAIPIGSQPLFKDTDVTLVHEVIRPNGERCTIVGTQTTLYRYFSQTGGGYYEDIATYYDNVPTPYFEDDPGQWVVIGDGFSTSGKRWQAVDLNGYVILNNQVDLPVTYRVEDFEVTPIYEMRELGIASIGCITEFDTYLLCGDIRQIRAEDLSTTLGLLNSGNTIGTQTGAVSSSDSNIVGTIEAGSTTLNATGSIFSAGHVGKSIRFVNGFTATISAYYSATSVAVSEAATYTTSGLVFIITRPVLSGRGTVRNTNVLEAYWKPGDAAVFATDMDGEYYVLFENGWSSGITSVSDFKTLTLVKTPTMPINGMGFQIFPSEYLMTLSGGAFVFDDSMTGSSLFYGYKHRQILSVVNATNALTSSDYPLAMPLTLTNPAAYGAYTGTVDRIGYRILWGLPGQPRKLGASGPVSILTGDTLLRLDYPMKSLAVGDVVLVVGAGVTGGNLLSTIRFVSGTTVTLADRAGTTVGGDPITAATLTRASTTATFTSVTPHFLADDQSVTISGATPIEFNGVYAITVTGATTFTYELAEDPGANATGSISALLARGLIGQADSLGSSAGYEDLQDDGSTILQMVKLLGALVVYRETSIFLGGPSGQNNIPFAFDITYGGTRSGDRAGTLAFPNAVANVTRGGEQFHLYIGKNDFYYYDLVTRTPQIFGPLHNVRNLFFNEIDEADADDVFVADNPVTREMMFCYPSRFDGSGGINPDTGVPPPALPGTEIEISSDPPEPPIVVDPPVIPPPPPPPPFVNTQQCFTASCLDGFSGADKTVCVDDGTFPSVISQADADDQAMASAEEQANALLVCLPVCVDESCPTGFVWDYDLVWICDAGANAPGTSGGVGVCRDLVAQTCIKDFTHISLLVLEIPLYDYPPPNDEGYNCEGNSDPSRTGRGLAAALDIRGVHPEYVYGVGVDPDIWYTVTIRVRGVFEMKQYANQIPPVPGHVDPEQPYVFIIDPVPHADNLDVEAGGGENEYHFRIQRDNDPIDRMGYKFMLNNRHVGAPPGLGAHDYTFKVQVKKGDETYLNGTSVDLREYPNTPIGGFTPLAVGGVGIKRTEPVEGQFLQLDVISIDYTP